LPAALIFITIIGPPLQRFRHRWVTRYCPPVPRVLCCWAAPFGACMQQATQPRCISLETATDLPSLHLFCSHGGCRGVEADLCFTSLMNGPVRRLSEYRIQQPLGNNSGLLCIDGRQSKGSVYRASGITHLTAARSEAVRVYNPRSEADQFRWTNTKNKRSVPIPKAWPTCMQSLYEARCLTAMCPCALVPLAWTPDSPWC